MDSNKNRHDAIVHHTDEANLALQKAVHHLEDSGAVMTNWTVDQQLAHKQAAATAAVAAARIADAHMRLLELKLEIGTPAL